MKTYHATVFQQHPAKHEVADFRNIGQVSGSYDECWKQAQEMTLNPVLEFHDMRYKFAEE